MTNPALQPHPAESFHSFVFRICRLYGGSGMPNIINNDGNRWSRNIYLNDDVRPYFLKYSDKQLIHLMRNSGFAHKRTKMFEDPTYYTTKLHTFIFGSKSHKATYGISDKCDKPTTKPITYCIDCIRASLLSNGFSYFSAENYLHWLSHCRIHKKSLYVLPSTSRTNGMKSLSLILKGQHPANASLITTAPYKEYRHLANYGKKETEVPIQLSACLHFKLKQWFLINTHVFPQCVADAACYKDPRSMRNIDSNHVFRDYILERVVKALLESDYEPFHNFWNSNVTEKTIFCGVIDKSGLQEQIYVYKNIDCKFCTGREWILCPKNNLNSQKLTHAIYF